MKCEKNSFHVVTMADPDTPYQIWQGDKWKCEGCGQETVAGYGRKPISEHHSEDFQRLLLELEPLEVT
jgi:hypothetical protein